MQSQEASTDKAINRCALGFNSSDIAAALGSSMCPRAEGMPRATMGAVYLKVYQSPLAVG